ncbi:MAG: hypothetical protein M1530_02795 [Candidatus Marsarchaeota archaeon]|nr:hypothetical protein [Candidatus Marsarchaeota archaeon]
MDELAAEIGEVVFDHTKRQQMCVVFPAYGKAEYLLGNLELMRKQTHVPDILVIGGEKTEEVIASLAGSDLPIMAFKRNPKYFGPAGGFYAGEKLALAKGYEKIVLGDEDAYLKENDTLALIRDSLDVHPLVMIREDLSRTPAGMHHFAGIRRGAMLRVGLSYFPAYACFEDGEYQRRFAKNGIAPFVIDRYRTHPMKETGLMFGWLLMRNNLKHYLYQEPSLGHYLKLVLRAKAMEMI